jgi:hypothetical protein
MRNEITTAMSIVIKAASLSEVSAFHFSFYLFGRSQSCACFQHPKSIITNQKLDRTILGLVEFESARQNPIETMVIRIEPVETKDRNHVTSCLVCD